MFKKSEPEIHQHDFTPATARQEEFHQPRIQATIGSTIRINGDVTGEENLTIDGTVEGTVTVKQHSLQVGKNGKVNADIFAKVIRIEGNVEGNLYADDQVTVRSSGIVRGNIVSPRLTMEDGCSFKGSVDMESRSVEKKSAVDTAGRHKASSANGGDGTPVTGADHKVEPTAARAG